MSQQEDEVRRLQRLRDEQLSVRDPQAKGSATSQRLSERYRWSKKKTSLWDIVDDVPAKWVYKLIGASVALIPNILVEASSSPMAGDISILFGVVDCTTGYGVPSSVSRC